MLFDSPPSDWRTTTLGEICREGGGDIQTGPFGSQLHASDYVDAGIPSIMPANIKDGRVVEDGIARITQSDAKRLSKYLVAKGDIVYSRRGDVERCALIREKESGWLCGTGCLRVRPGADVIDSDFCAHFLSHPETREWISRHAVGATMPNLNTQILSEVPILLPPKREQKAIAHILGTLDDRIELNRKTNETLEVIAKALFKSWFVDFDPVRAKAEGRPTGLPAEVSDLFPDSFEDSELGEIPSGWEMEALGEILDVDKGVSYKGDFLSDTEGLPMVNLGCFAGGGSFRAEKMKFYAGEYREKHLASAGDLLVANTDMTQNRIILGAPIIVPSWRGRDKFLFSHHTFAIRFRHSKSAFTRFIYFTLLKPSFRQVASGHATGTTVLALPKDGITDYQTVIPPAGLLNVFAAKVEALYQKCQALTEQCELLAKTRDALLPKLISGEIRIPDAEKMLEEVGI